MENYRRASNFIVNLMDENFTNQVNDLNTFDNNSCHKYVNDSLNKEYQFIRSNIIEEYRYFQTHIDYYQV